MFTWKGKNPLHLRLIRTKPATLHYAGQQAQHLQPHWWQWKSWFLSPSPSPPPMFKSLSPRSHGLAVAINFKDKSVCVCQIWKSWESGPYRLILCALGTWSIMVWRVNCTIVIIYACCMSLCTVYVMLYWCIAYSMSFTATCHWCVSGCDLCLPGGWSNPHCG